MAKRSGRRRFARRRSELRRKWFDFRHVRKHIPGTPQAERLVRKEGAAHVFKDEATMRAVVEAIMERGQMTGTLRGHERWGLWFEQPIGFRIDRVGHRLALHYAELKVRGDAYHVIPRSRPAE
jgi:hypothetical protein